MLLRFRDVVGQSAEFATARVELRTLAYSTLTRGRRQADDSFPNDIEEGVTVSFLELNYSSTTSSHVTCHNKGILRIHIPFTFVP